VRSVVLALPVAVLLVGAAAPWRGAGSTARLRGLAVTAPARGQPPADRGADRGAAAPVLDLLVLLDLVDAAVAAGAGLPRALAAVGDAAGGPDGAAMRRASSALVMGADWSAAWAGAPARLGPVIDGLAPTWATGAAPGPVLRAAAEHVRRERRRATREAAARLGVHLVLPLGLCFLPAFMLIGLVPVLISLGAGLLG